MINSGPEPFSTRLESALYSAIYGTMASDADELMNRQYSCIKRLNEFIMHFSPLIWIAHDLISSNHRSTATHADIESKNVAGIFLPKSILKSSHHIFLPSLAIGRQYSV